METLGFGTIYNKSGKSLLPSIGVVTMKPGFITSDLEQSTEQAGPSTGIREYRDVRMSAKARRIEQGVFRSCGLSS